VRQNFRKTLRQNFRNPHGSVAISCRRRQIGFQLLPELVDKYAEIFGMLA